MILQRKVEVLRERMIQLVNEKGSFIDDDVVAISQELDRVIVKIQQINIMRARKETKTYDEADFSERSSHLSSGTSRPSLKNRKQVL